MCIWQSVVCICVTGARRCPSWHWHAVCCFDTPVAKVFHHHLHSCVWCSHHDHICWLLCGVADAGHTHLWLSAPCLCSRTALLVQLGHYGHLAYAQHYGSISAVEAHSRRFFTHWRYDTTELYDAIESQIVYITEWNFMLLMTDNDNLFI